MQDITETKCHALLGNFMEVDIISSLYNKAITFLLDAEILLFTGKLMAIFISFWKVAVTKNYLVIFQRLIVMRVHLRGFSFQ